MVTWLIIDHIIHRFAGSLINITITDASDDVSSQNYINNFVSPVHMHQTNISLNIEIMIYVWFKFKYDLPVGIL